MGKRLSAVVAALSEGRAADVLRTVLAAYFLISLAGADLAVLGAPLPGRGLAAMALVVVIALRMGRERRHRWSRAGARDWLLERWAPLTVAALTVVGLALRVRGIAFGDPAVLHPDESVVVAPVLYMLRRGWIDPPVPYHYPTVFKYLLLPGLALTYVLGRARGEWASLDEVFRHEFAFYLVARYHSAVLGALTIPLVYVLARRVVDGPRGRVAGVVAATMLTFSFIHVRESHFAVTDAALTFFATIALILIVRMMRDDRWHAHAVAGFAAGLACAVKYSALPLVLVLPLAHLIARPPERWLDARPLLALAMAPVGFFTGYPYALLRYRPFLEHLGWIRRFQEFDAAERLRIIVGYAGESGLGMIATLVLGAACLWWLHRGARRQILLVVYIAVSLYTLTHTGHRFFPRYLLPLLPAIGVIVGGFVAAAVERAGRTERLRSPPVQAALVASIAFVLVLSPAAESLRWTGMRLLPDTRGLVHAWLVDTYPPGTVVASDVRYLRLPPPYRVVELAPIEARSAPSLRRQGVDLVITSAQIEEDFAQRPRGRTAWRQLTRRLELVRELEPTALNGRGPVLRVYRLRPPTGTEEAAAPAASDRGSAR